MLKQPPTSRIFHSHTVHGACAAGHFALLLLRPALSSSTPHWQQPRRFPPAIWPLIPFPRSHRLNANAQDVLVVTAPGSGAEIIPFLKTWVNLPMAVGFTIAYAKVCAWMMPMQTAEDIVHVACACSSLLSVLPWQPRPPEWCHMTHNPARKLPEVWTVQ